MTVGKAVAELIADVLVVGRIVDVFIRAATGSIILAATSKVLVLAFVLMLFNEIECRREIEEKKPSGVESIMEGNRKAAVIGSTT
jgi:hypothetical protein